jgi:hypothetical protein
MRSPALSSLPYQDRDACHRPRWPLFRARPLWDAPAGCHLAPSRSAGEQLIGEPTDRSTRPVTTLKWPGRGSRPHRYGPLVSGGAQR